MGAAARKQLLEEFVQLQLVAYENLFGAGKQHFVLEQVERRWSWFKRLLKYVDSKFGTIFPTHWRLPLRLCLEFCERTKMHLILLLTEMESADRTDVHALLKALQSALRFEQEMSERFHLLQELEQSRLLEAAHAKQMAEELRVQNRLKQNDKLMYIPTDHTAINKEDETESGFLSLAHSAILGGISGVFDKFLGSYVLLERQNLEDMLQRLSQEEDTPAEGVGAASGGTYGNIYGSSTAMFVFIKQSIKRCTALTTGQTFLSLSKEFKTCMIQYVEMLMKRCPPAVPLGGNLVTYKLPPNGEMSLCYLINTGEYCAEVVPQLEQMVQAKIQPTLSAKVSFDTEVDAFMDLVAHCIKVLVAGIMDRLEPSFRTMAGINWAGFTSVGEESQYLHTCNAVLVDAIPKIRETLSASYFTNLCNKIASEILARWASPAFPHSLLCEADTASLLTSLSVQVPGRDREAEAHLGDGHAAAAARHVQHEGCAHATAQPGQRQPLRRPAQAPHCHVPEAGEQQDRAHRDDPEAGGHSGGHAARTVPHHVARGAARRPAAADGAQGHEAQRPAGDPGDVGPVRGWQDAEQDRAHHLRGGG